MLIGLLLPLCLAGQLMTGSIAGSDQENLILDVVYENRVATGSRDIYFRLVEPPVLPPPIPEEKDTSRTEELDEATLQDIHNWASKPMEHIWLHAIVYDGELSEITFSPGGTNVTLFSEIDFNLLQGTLDVETEEKRYRFFIMTTNSTREQVTMLDETMLTKPEAAWTPKWLPDLDAFPTEGVAEYITLENDAAIDFEPIDILHSYYDARQAELKSRHEAAQQARELRQNTASPVQPDTIIHFWPIKSRSYNNANQ